MIFLLRKFTLSSPPTALTNIYHYCTILQVWLIESIICYFLGGYFVKGPASPWRALSLVTIISLNLAVSTLVGVWVGNKLDRYFSTSPWLMIVGVLLGIGAGLVTIIPIVKKFLGDQADD